MRHFTTIDKMRGGNIEENVKKVRHTDSNGRRILEFQGKTYGGPYPNLTLTSGPSRTLPIFLFYFKEVYEGIDDLRGILNQ